MASDEVIHWQPLAEPQGSRQAPASCSATEQEERMGALAGWKATLPTLTAVSR